MTSIYNPFAHLVEAVRVPVFDRIDRRKPATPFDNAGSPRLHPTSFKMKILILQSEPFAASNLIALMLSASVAFLLPIQKFIIMALVLVAVDAITGLRASRVKGQKYDNAKFRRSVDKFIFYTIAILLSAAVSKVFINDSTYLTYAISSLICWIEFKSNIDNISAITGNNLWKSISDAVSNRFKIKDDTTGSK